MVRSISLFIAIVISLNIHSGEKGKAWEAWFEFRNAVKSQNYDLAKSLTSGTWVDDHKFTKKHLSLLAWELHKNPVKFVNEFKLGNDYILVLKSWITPISLTFTLSNNKLKISKWAMAELKPDEAEKKIDHNIARVKIKLANIRFKLRKIGQAYREFCKQAGNRLFPDSSQLTIDDEVWEYLDPETGKLQKILPIAAGHKWTNSRHYPAAITSSTILGEYYAVFDNGNVRAFHKGYFPVIIENYKHSLKANVKQNELIIKLGHEDRDIRKKTKEKIKQIGYSLAPVLQSYIDHQDPEISMTVKDILKELKAKNQFRHAVYELEKVPRSLTVGLGKYFIVETEKNFLAIKLLKHTRPFKKYDKVENYGAEYEVSAFSKDGKKIGTQKGEVFQDPNRKSKSMNYISYNDTFVHWEMGDNIFFDAHALAIAKTGYSDLNQIDVTSKEYPWFKKKIKSSLRKGPSIEIIVNPNFYSYQGNKRSLDEMERTLMGVGAAMGADVHVVIRVDSKAEYKMVKLLMQRMVKHHLTNFKVEEYKVGDKTKNKAQQSKDDPVLVPIRIEKVK